MNQRQIEISDPPGFARETSLTSIHSWAGKTLHRRGGSLRAVASLWGKLEFTYLDHSWIKFLLKRSNSASKWIFLRWVGYRLFHRSWTSHWSYLSKLWMNDFIVRKLYVLPIFLSDENSVEENLSVVIEWSVYEGYFAANKFLGG